MTRGSLFAGITKTAILSAALVAGLALPAKADDTKLTLTGSATMTTDYMFRSISNTNQEPAVQPEFDLTYGMFYAYVWGSNTAFGDGIELDYGIGITPKWKNITFNIAGLYYTYPGDNENIGYFELKTGASWTGGAWTLAANNYWSPDNSSSLATPTRLRERSAMRWGISGGTSSRRASAALWAISPTRRMPTTTPIGMRA